MGDQQGEFSYLFAALHVSERDGALRWYERLFGRAPNFLPTDAEAVWQVAETASVYILADGSYGGGEVNLIVPDLDFHLAALEGRGIDAEPVVVIESAGRKARVLDPDGNAIWFTELTT